MESAVICPSCEVEVDEEERFCPYCGEELTRWNNMEVKKCQKKVKKRKLRNKLCKLWESALIAFFMVF